MVVRLLRDSWRAWRRSPVTAAVCALTLALGLAATTTFYAIVDHLLLQPLPVPRPHELVQLGDETEPRGPVSFPVWEQLAARTDLVGGAFAWWQVGLNLAPRGEIDMAQVGLASGGVFRTLQVQAAMGRLFDERDDVVDGGPDGWVAVITHASWRRRYGGAPDIVGRRIDVERVPVTIIGVLPPSFRGLRAGTSLDMLLPLQAERRVHGYSFMARDHWTFLTVVMRLKPGASREALQAALRAAQPAIRDATLHTMRGAQERDAYLRSPFVVHPAADGGAGLAAYYGQAAVLLLALGVLVLVACCGNVATVLLAHGANREQELAVRVALGASRWEPARQLVADGLVLSMTGIVVAMAITGWAGPWLMAQWQQSMLDAAVTPWQNPRVWILASGGGVLTGLVCALGAARRAMRRAPLGLLQTGGARVTTAERSQRLVMALQLAFSTIVLVTGALLLRSYADVTSAPVLARLESVVAARLRLAESLVPEESREALVERARSSLESAVPGAVTSAATILPFHVPQFVMAVLDAEGSRVPTPGQMVLLDPVTPSHFRVLGLRLRAGRWFDGRETPGPVVTGVVNQTFARTFLGGETRVPQRIRADIGRDRPEEVEIVGVVDDVPYQFLFDEPAPLLYVPRTQLVPLTVHAFLLVRGTDRRVSPADVRAALARAAPELSFTMTSIAQAARDQFERERVLALVAGFFAALAALIATVGVFGVSSYAVTTRRREIGIRLAVGALPRQVRALVVGRALRTVLAGAAGGLIAAWWTTRLVAALLVNTDVHDPWVFGGAATALVALGMAAAWWPARRAARLDPAAVLRSE